MKTESIEKLQQALRGDKKRSEDEREQLINEMLQNEKLISNEQLYDSWMAEVEKTLTKILRNSNQESRRRLEKMLKKWTLRVLFVDSLREEKDNQEEERSKT